MRGGLRTWLLERGGALALLTLAVYVWLAPSYFIFGDNAEFCALSVVGGVAHPSGYPLYVLWLRAWSWLPTDSPAHAAAIATAILTAVEALALHAACRAWGARPNAATVATALFLASPIVLRIQSTAEVFAFNGLVVATIAWLAASEGPLRGGRRVIALALVAGLGLSNHLTCAFALPIGILGVARGMRETNRRALTGVAGIAALALGLTPYLYMLVAPRTELSWRTIDSVDAIVRHVLRADYGTAKLSGRGGAPQPGGHLLALGKSIGRAYLWIPALLAVGGLGYFAVRGGQRESRRAWIALALAFVLCGPAFVARFNIHSSGIGLYTVQRMHALPLLLLAIPLASAFDLLIEKLGRPLFANRPIIASVLASSAFLLGTALSLPAVWRAHSPAAQRGLENVLRTLPPDAVVIGSTDEFHFGLDYLRIALHERADVVPITTPQLGLPEVRQRIHDRLGFTIENAAAGEKLSVKVAEQVLATGRPLFIDSFQANIATTFPTYPYGILFRVLPRGTQPPPIEEVFAINKQLFEQFRLDYSIPGTDDVLATQFHHQYERVWLIIADALHAAGHREDEAVARAMADALRPRD